MSLFNLDLEAGILGAIMIAGDFEEVSLSLLAEEMFYKQSHSIIFAAMKSLKAQGQGIDVLTVSQCLKEQSSPENDLLEGVGGLSYLVGLSDFGSASFLESYVAQLRGVWQRRKTVQLLNESLVAVTNGESFDDVKTSLAKGISELEFNSDKPPKLIHEHALNAISRWENGESENMFSMKSGLDEILSWQPKLILIKAKTSIGKSIFGLQIALTAAHQGLGAVYFSLEMPPHEVAIRALAAYGRAPNRMKYDLLAGRDSDVKTALDELSKMNLEITQDETSDIQILRKTEERLRTGAKLIVIDYLQIVTMTSGASRRDIDLALFTTALKKLQIRYGAIIIILSQVNAQGDARESQSTENDVDAIIHIKREPIGEGKLSDEVDIYLEKNRQGERGKIRLYHNPGRFLFQAPK